MKRSTGPLLLSILTVTAVFAGCSDDPPPQGTPGGSSGSTTGGSSAGSTTAGSTAGGNNTGGIAGSMTGGGGAMAGTAGTAGGGAGGTGGTTAGTAGTGGTPEPVVPTIVLIDNVRLQLKPGVVEGGGGAGGEGGAGSGDEPGAGGFGMGGELGFGGEGLGGGGGEGGESDPGIIITEPGMHGFLYPFDANIMPFAFNAGGFSPGPGGSGGPNTFQGGSTVAFDAAGGHPGGAMKLTLPFTAATQQADVAGNFTVATDLTGYELYAEVKLVSSGFSDECISTWAYVYGNGSGYANDKSGEPVMRTTQPLEKDEWVVVRLDLDGPYGAHSTPTFNPGSIQIYGFQVNTWGCP